MERNYPGSSFTEPGSAAAQTAGWAYKPRYERAGRFPRKTPVMEGLAKHTHTRKSVKTHIKGKFNGVNAFLARLSRAVVMLV